MAKYGKWIGGGLGWALGGPIGAVIGFAVGSYYDNIDTAKRSGNVDDFNISLLILSAAVMKADGRILKSELNIVKNFFQQQFGPQMAQRNMLLLREILKKEYSVREVCLQIKGNMPHQARLLLVKFLMDIANADGELHNSEKQIIHTICRYLGVSDADFQSLTSMYVKDISSCYKVLEVSETATNAEIKSAYRRLAIKHHPDKVAHLGEKYQKAAKEKFQIIQEAYEQVKKDRNIV